MKFTKKTLKAHPAMTVKSKEVDFFEGVANLDQYQEQMPLHVTSSTRGAHISCDPCDGCDCGASD